MKAMANRTTAIIAVGRLGMRRVFWVMVSSSHAEGHLPASACSVRLVCETDGRQDGLHAFGFRTDESLEFVGRRIVVGPTAGFKDCLPLGGLHRLLDGGLERIEIGAFDARTREDTAPVDEFDIE